MKIKQAFGKSLKKFRQVKGITQEDFSVVSGRTYISMLERGQRSPTLDKIEVLAKVLKIHPISLLYLTFMHAGGHQEIESLFGRIRSDLKEVV